MPNCKLWLPVKRRFRKNRDREPYSLDFLNTCKQGIKLYTTPKGGTDQVTYFQRDYLRTNNLGWGNWVMGSN